TGGGETARGEAGVSFRGREALLLAVCGEDAKGVKRGAGGRAAGHFRPRSPKDEPRLPSKPPTSSPAGVGRLPRAYREFSYQTTLLVPITMMSGAPSAFMSRASMPETATLPMSSMILSHFLVLGT